MPPKTSDLISDKAADSNGEALLNREEVLRLYRKLLLARLCEEKIRAEYAKNEMKTPVHLGIGQEAIAVGVCHSLPPQIRAFGTYRNHALYLALTENTDGFFGEIYGKITGPGKGKAGSMHLSSPEKGLIATSAVVGTTLPVAVGAALANQYRKRDDFVVAFLGDGAMEEGVFWESLNFACLRRLKILFVCEDNGLAIHALADQRQGFRSAEEAVSGFRCHVAGGNGSDLMEVVRVTRRMLVRMAEDPKPGFLHFNYFRFLEHVGVREDFSAGYRRKPTPEELERLDPVAIFERTGFPPEMDGAQARAKIRAELTEKVNRSVLQARQAPFAPMAELYTDLFA